MVGGEGENGGGRNFFQQESERGQFVTRGMNGTAQVRLAEAATVMAFWADHPCFGRREVCLNLNLDLRPLYTSVRYIEEAIKAI